jgi:hypothetical protein
MAKKYKIVVSNSVRVPVEGSIADAEGKPQKFKFALICDRIDQQSMREQFQGQDLVFSDFLKKVTKGWEGQRLVLNDDDTPAAFDVDALDALLNITGMGLVCYNAYTAENAAKGKM